MRISTKGRGIIKAQQGTVARPNPKENYKLPEDQRYQAQAAKDADVSPYMKSDEFEVTIGNLREYQE